MIPPERGSRAPDIAETALVPIPGALYESNPRPDRMNSMEFQALITLEIEANSVCDAQEVVERFMPIMADMDEIREAIAALAMPANGPLPPAPDTFPEHWADAG